MSKLVGDRIYNLRKKLGLSQEEFANRIGVTRQVVSKWESNQVIPLMDKLKRISEEFNVSYDEIFLDGFTGNSKKKEILKYIVMFIILIVIETLIIFIYTYIQDERVNQDKCLGTMTYYIDQIYDSDDDNYKYVTLINNDSVKTIKMKKIITNNLDVNNSYEFVYRSNKDLSIEELVRDDKIINIIKSNKDRNEWINMFECEG